MLRAVGLMGEGETGVDGSGDLKAWEVVEAVGRASASLGLAVRASILTVRWRWAVGWQRAWRCEQQFARQWCGGGGIAEGKRRGKTAAMSSREGSEETRTDICKITCEGEDWTGQST